MALLFYCENKCDPVGIQTQDLQNRNLTLYSAKLRGHDYVMWSKGKYFF